MSDAAAAPRQGRAPAAARIRSLDGLRGLAVAAVVAFHLGYLKGGYLGVDMFFVLSGYLITGLLLRGEGPGVSGRLVSFWRRRARRILPAQFLLLLAVAVFAVVAADEATRVALRGDGLATVLGVANWNDMRSADSYWDLFIAPSPLTHVWSLSVELQLYLLWPLVARVVYRRAGGAMAVARTALGLAAISAGWAMVLFSSGASADRVYLGTDTRAAALLMGAALAALEVARRERGEDPHIAIPAVSGLVAIGAIAILWVSMDGLDPTLYRGGLLLHGVASVVLVAVAVGPVRRWLHPILETPPLVGLGIISYGVYLWHWLVIVWVDEARTGVDGIGLLTIRLALTLVLSLASYVLVEQPLRRGVVADRWLPAVVPAASLGVLLALGLATAGADAAPRTFTQRVGSADDLRPRALVIGDSLALNLATEMRSLDADRGVRIEAEVYPGCTIVPEGTLQMLRGGPEPAGGCGPFDNAEAALAIGLQRAVPREVIVVFALPDVPEQRRAGRWVQACLDDGAAVRDRQLRALVPEDPSVRVTFLTTPMPGNGRVGGLISTSLSISEQELQSRIACHNDALRRIADDLAPQVQLLDLAARVCTERPCPDGDDELRPDGVHLAGDGLTDVAGWVFDAVDEPAPAVPPD